ncbi:NAD(P)/FAD-dependent oxidoreductase [Pseudomonas lurida]|uniref:phytoene desaturase family protein n=1 Tax=Pseudomonas lurida TaxID=244566 RepID=UPI001654751D|nr:NAD(P)/FAD-dependent oxidoreductase [Pseudomonas lurida]MBC3924195.1 NAD(P)/FAD-dependent oxidoreductase [Pseudomonas lurida]
MSQFDAVIVGAGHNGLVCAAYLAKAGKKVCVVERRNIVGGAALTEELWPGFHLSVASYWMSLMQPKIMLDLDLLKYGVEVIPTPPGIHPFQDGSVVTHWSDVDRMCAEIRRYSDKDADVYPAYVEHMKKLVGHLRKLLFEVPIDIATGKVKDLTKSAALLWRMKAAGPMFYDIWDLLTLSCHDFLRRWFESPQVLTMFGCYTSGSGGNIGPMVPGTAYVLARPYLRDGNTKAGPGGLVKGGMGALVNAIKQACLDHGVTIRCSAPVKEIVVKDKRAAGVRLESGEVIHAKSVVSNANAKTLFLRLLKPQDLPPAVIDAVKRIRTKASTFKINMALSGLPKWQGLKASDNQTPGSITIAENLEELQTAFESAQHGEMAKHPYMWILTPSVFDPTAAPEGKHTMSLLGGHVPYALRDGRPWDETTKEELFNIVVNQIERYAPGFRELVLHKQVLVPSDLEAMFDLPDGHVHHGELSIDQIFFRRPIAHYADYRSPIAGLYQCGASTHPGGGVTGVPGHNAAQVILSEI